MRKYVRSKKKQKRKEYTSGTNRARVMQFFFWVISKYEKYIYKGGA